MFKTFQTYQEKVKYAQELLAIFNNDPTFKKIFGKKSAFPDKDFNKMIGSDESVQASDIKHIFNSGKDIYSNLSDISKVGSGEPSEAEKQMIDNALNNVTRKLAELYPQGGKTPSEKLSSYMQATNNTKVSKGVLPFVYSLIDGIEKTSAKTDRDVNKEFMDKFQGIEDDKNKNRKIAVDSAKKVTSFTEKYKMNPDTVLSLSDDAKYTEAAKKVLASGIDMDKITDPKDLGSLNASIKNAIELEIERSNIMRQNDNILASDSDFEALKDAYKQNREVRERLGTLTKEINKSKGQERKIQEGIILAKNNLENRARAIGADKIATYKSQLSEKRAKAETLSEYRKIAMALAQAPDKEVAPEYAEKVEAMKQYCMQVKDTVQNSRCETFADMRNIITWKLSEADTDLTNFKRAAENTELNSYVEEEERIRTQEEVLKNAKQGTKELEKQYRDASDTDVYQKNFYEEKAQKLSATFNAKFLQSTYMEHYDRFVEMITSKKQTMLADNKARLNQIDADMPMNTSAIFVYANRYQANKAGLNKDNVNAKIKGVFDELNEVRNSGIKLKEQLPEIKRKEGEIFEAGQRMRECVGTIQLKSMIDRLNAFIPDPEKKGNSEQYKAMFTAINNAKAEFAKDNLTKEEQLRAVQGIKNAANKYLDAKSHQISFWPFSSNQRYARILNAKSMAKAAEQMEEIVNSMGSLEVDFDKLMTPNGKYDINKQDYSKNLMSDIIQESKAPAQPEKVNEINTKQQDQNVLY